MSLDACKSAARTSVISISWMSNAGVGRPEVPDKGEDPKAICNHGQGIPLGHFLLAMKEMTVPVACSDHQFVPVAVSVKFKPRTTGTLVAHCPQFGCEVLLIERIVRVNE